MAANVAQAVHRFTLAWGLDPVPVLVSRERTEETPLATRDGPGAGSLPPPGPGQRGAAPGHREPDPLDEVTDLRPGSAVRARTESAQ